ncbi:zinc-dependent alcohol dehydrogenase [Streptomyces radiopugnans]|uniref:zinc-dependent alcohol dehydrogenase n=1 Tax=Streptomyces radiopugnans TaxID=403935 RepID=UPI003F1A7D43
MFGAALGRAATVGHPKMTPPATLGSLLVGEVVSVGDAVDHVRIGDRAVVDPHPPCGHCRKCSAGMERACGDGASLRPGALAEVVCVSGDTRRAVRPLPDAACSADAVIFTEPLACALGAVHDGAVTSADDVLIVGSGQLAFLLSHAVRLAGAASVTCLVKDPSRSPTLQAAGARTVSLTPDGSTPTNLRQGFSVVIEAVGRETTYQASFDAVKPGGTVVAFGGCPPGTRLMLDINALHYAGIRLVGSYHYPPHFFGEALGLLVRGAVDTTPLQGHILPLGDIAKAPHSARRPGVMALLVSP